MLLLSTRSLSGYGLDKIFTLAKSAGCDGIDISVDFSLFDTIDPVYLQLLSVRHSLPILSITAPARRVTKKQSSEILALAEILDVKIVNFTPPQRTDKDKETQIPRG
jgi:hypothetical protein